MGDAKSDKQNESLSAAELKKRESYATDALEKDIEGSPKKLRYPTHVAFIVGNEFCERFSYYGMRAVLNLYFTTQLMWDEDTATVIFHTFNTLCYFTPLLGAIIADSWLGKFRTIFYMSVLYACGNVLVAVGSIGFNGEVVFCMIGLVVIALGTGGIKPCVSSFGGDQFVLPQQAEQLAQFFSIFYFSINAGSFCSTIITPVLRSDVKCFGSQNCFFAAFGIPSVLFIVSIFLFMFGRSRYTMIPPDRDSLIVRFVKCIWNALSLKIKNRKSGEKKEHWMDYSEERFGKQFVEDCKSVLRVLFLYIPLPIYNTLYDQSSSRWIFQCTRMNGKLGDSIVLKPDQMNAVNAILILAFIPLFDRVIYPLLAKCHLLKKSLHRMIAGGLLYSVAFVISGILELKLEDTYAVLPTSSTAHLSVTNGVGCNMTVTIPDIQKDSFVIAPFTEHTFVDIESFKEMNIHFEIENIDKCEGNIIPVKDGNDTSVDNNFKFTPNKGTAHAVLLHLDPSTRELMGTEMEEDDKEKDAEGLIRGRAYYNIHPDIRKECNEITFDADHRRDKGDKSVEMAEGKNIGTSEYVGLEPYVYTMEVCDVEGENTKMLEMGGVYNVLVQQFDENTVDVHYIAITKPNTYHMFLTIPQFTVLTAGEILFQITGLEFSYAQAPTSMKSILSAAWLMNTAIGNVIVIILESIRIFDSQAYDFFLYAGIEVGAVLVFAVLAYNYVPYNPSVKKEGDEDEKEEEAKETISPPSYENAVMEHEN